MLSLSLRDGYLDDKYSGKRIEKDGQPDRRTLKLGLVDIELTKNEFNAILGEPFAYDQLYDTSKKPHMPILRGIKALELVDKWESAYVAIHYELGASQLVFKKATLSKIKLHMEPDEDGKYAPRLSCQVEGEPALDIKVVEIIDRTGSLVQVEIRAESPSTQSELPINRVGEDEAPDSPLMGGGRYRKRDRPDAH